MINLLPKERKAHKRLLSKLYVLIVVYVIILVAIFILYLTARTYMYSNQIALDALVAQNSEQPTGANGELLAKAALIEDRLTAAHQYTGSTDWKSILSLITATLPTNISLDSVKLKESTNGVEILLAGSATERRDIILFNTKLAEEKGVISSSLQSIGGGGDGYTFSIQAIYKESK